MNANIYAGGVPEHGVKLHPSLKSEGEETVAPGGELGEKTSHGGPATFSGSETRDFLNDKSYHAGDLEPGRPKGMKIVNPDDISHSA